MTKITKQTRFYLSIILLNICSNIFSMYDLMYKQMPKLPKPILTQEKKQKIKLCIKEYTQEFNNETCQFRSTDQSKYVEMFALREQILNTCIYHGLEDWFTPENIELVQDILNKPTGFNPTGLIYFSKVFELESSDFNPEFANYSGSRFEDIALLRAIRLNQINIAIKLISSGYVNVKITGKKTQQTPLHLAVLTGNIPLVRLLLIQGANPIAYDNSYPYDISYLTPLDYANQVAQMPDIKPEMKENMQAIIKLLVAAENKQ